MEREINYWHFANGHTADEIINRMGWVKNPTTLDFIFQVSFPDEDEELFDFIFDQF